MDIETEVRQMIFVMALSESLLYLAFSVLIGGLFLLRVPVARRPSLHLPKSILLGCIIAIIIFSFPPVLQVILYFYKNMDFNLLIQNVFFSFEIGKAWLVTFIASILLFILLLFTDIENNPKLVSAALIWSVFLIFTVSYSSHANSLVPFAGLVAHFCHFLAMSLWTGILIIVSWFSNQLQNWKAFSRWFTPLSISCVTIVLIAGLVLMQFIVPEYWNSWLLPYGEALLIKHLLFVMILIFACINGFVLKEETRRLPWLKAESLLIMVVYLVTGFLGQSPSPHNVLQTIKTEGFSPLLLAIFQENWHPDLHADVQLQLNLMSLLLLLFSLFFLTMLIIAYKKRTPPYFAMIMCIGWVISVFLGIMFSITLIS